MDPKSELLVFNKKEIIVIIVLLILVAMFSFTLGLKLGKTLGAGEAHVEHASGSEHSEEVVPIAEKKEEVAKPEEEAHDELDLTEKNTHKAKLAAPAPKMAAEDRADAELAHELASEKVGTSKPVPMSLPKQKKAEMKGSGVRYTLQVGSYRTVAEAAEQVSTLKRRDLDAFYLEAHVPGKGTWYRVGIGVYPSREAAEGAAPGLKSKQLPTYIVQKIGE